LLNKKLVVNYVRDNTGLVHEVWILNAEEAKEKRAGRHRHAVQLHHRLRLQAPVDNGKTPYHQLPAYQR
jgi:hypothetical protein